MKYGQVIRLAIVTLFLAVLRTEPAIAGPVCRPAWPQAGMSGYQAFVRADLVVDYDFYATVEACEYGSGSLVTCELRAYNVYVERYISKIPPTGNEHIHTWALPAMAKGGFAKGHDCNDLIHDNEDDKWVVAVANTSIPGVVKQDKADIDVIVSTYYQEPLK